jgi:dihydroorotate dehydrogenase/Pyruvate/2-oxoacid:ferredoxin oxidoreductase delta subunit
MLETTLGPLTLANPIILGSGPSTDTYDDICRGQDAGAGAVITKSIGLHAPTPFAPTDQRRYQWIKGIGVHLKSTYLKEILSRDAGCDLVRRASATCDFPIIASIFVPALADDTDAQKWMDLARSHEQAGASAIQLDFFYIDLRKLSDERIAQTCRLVQSIIASVKIPVFPKLNTAMDDDLVRVLAAIDTAAGFILIDSIRVEPFIDVERRGAPLFDGALHRDGRSVSVIAGEALLPFTLSYTQRVSRLTAASLCSGGGLSTANHVLQCAMLGASSVHITSHFMHRGLVKIMQLRRDLEQQLHTLGYNSFSDVVGLSLQSTNNSEQRFVKPMPNRLQQVRFVDNLCTACGVCERLHVCDSFLSTPYALQANCDGCSLCVRLCPTDALVMEPISPLAVAAEPTTTES